MHNALSVVYPVGRCAFQAWLLVFLGLLSAAVGVLYLLVSDFSTTRPWGLVAPVAGVVGWMLWVAWALLSWFRTREGVLHWNPVRGQDGAEAGPWSWTDRLGAEPLRLSGVERVLDLQDRVLLRLLTPGAGQRWVWVERRDQPARWGDLRRALASNRT